LTDRLIDEFLEVFMALVYLSLVSVSYILIAFAISYTSASTQSDRVIIESEER
jgi:hypothetical protein